MKFHLFIVFALIGITIIDSHQVYRRQPSTTPEPTDEDSEIEIDDEDGDEVCERVPDRALMAAEYFPDTISRERALKMLKRAIELIEKPKSASKRPCRRDEDIDTDAKNALRFLTGEPNIGSTTEDSSQSATSQPEEYCPDALVFEGNRRISDQTARNIIRLHDRGYSEKAIQSQYRWYRRQYITRLRQYEAAGGSQPNNYAAINEYVQRRINDSLERQLPIHEYTLEQWGYEKADELGIDYFKASSNWITYIKKRGDLVGRKVTDLSSRADRAHEASIRESIEEFEQNYRYASIRYPHHRILNSDQSGHKYEISNLRSLGRRGSRDHVLAIDSANKNQHSYTIQPLIGRDGRLRGRLLICFREPADQFGPAVERRVRALERELGNVFVVASRSGKMSRRLTDQWLDELVVPEIERLSNADNESISSQDTQIGSQGSQDTEIIGSSDSQATDIAGPSWASNPPESWTPEQHRIMRLRKSTSGRRPGILLLVDSWGGHSSESLAEELYDRGIFVLRIPPRTTARLQPLDVQVFRQYKIFVKRVKEAASYEGMDRELSDRYGIMRMHSVIWNQLQAPVYRDMLLYAWRHTDVDFQRDEMERGRPPSMVLELQFDNVRRHACEVSGCEARAFIKCAHCGQHLCLRHFLDRKGFHEDLEHGNSSSTARPPRRDEDDEGSAGAAGAVAGAIGAGASAAGVASGAAIGASAVSIAGASNAASAGTSSVRLNSKEEERIPLVD